MRIPPHGLPSRFARPFFAITATAVAVFLRWLLDPFMGGQLPLVTLYGAVAATARGWERRCADVARGNPPGR